MSDQDWADVARESREALRLLGFSIGPLCLPDEPAACGATFSQHAAAHLATLKAVCDHQLMHLGPPPALVIDIYRHWADQLRTDHRCQGVPPT